MMNGLKIVLLTLYLASLTIVLKTPELTTGFVGLVVWGVLSYCGIIVVAHSAAFLYAGCRWLGKQQLSVSTVLDAETEAS